jgi:hypothetical protein
LLAHRSAIDTSPTFLGAPGPEENNCEIFRAAGAQVVEFE